MIRLHVADYQIIRGSSSQCGFQIFQKFRLFALVYRIHDRDLFIHNHV